MTTSADENPETIESTAEPVLIPEPELDAPEPPPVLPPPPPPPRKRRGGWLALLLGGVGAAALGAGATFYLLPQLPARWQPAAAMIAASDAAQAERLAAVQAELGALQASIPAAPDLGPLQTALAGLDARLAALEARPVASVADTGPAIEALQGELAAIRTELAQGATGTQATTAEIAAAAADASARIVAAEAEAAALRAKAEADAVALRAEAEAAASKAQARAAVAQLGAALDSGAPLAAPLAALGAAGITVPAALSADVPSLAALRDGFTPAARAALAAARTADPGASLMDRLGSYLLAQTGARSLEAREGDDADAVLSRAEAALATGDVEGALAAISALPEAGRAELANWAALAERRVAATQALAALAQGLN